MKESFIFYLSFYEALKELPDDIRLKLYDMIAIYALKDEEVDCDGIEKAVFSLIKPQIKANKQRYLNGCKGGAKKVTNPVKKRTKKTVAKQPNENQERTETEPNENQERTETQPNENENVNVNVNVIPLLYSPPRGQKTDEDLFFERYPRYAKDKAKARMDIDYKRLLEEFDRSSYCRNFYTMKQINDNYCLIVSGEFRDKPAREDSTEARAKRERFYSERQAKAQSIADKILNRFLQDEEFKRIHKRLRELELEIAKAEVAAENGSDKSKKELVKLTQEQGRLRQTRLVIIEKNGLSEEDLLPKWHCKKCSDTGYLANGAMCDCYEGD